MSPAVAIVLLLAAAPRPFAFDLREDRGRVARIAPEVARARADLRQSLGEHGVLDADARSGGIRFVGRLDGLLTEPVRGAPRDIALAWVKRNRVAFGLDESDFGALSLVEERTSPDGVTHLAWAQAWGGVPAIDGALRVHVARDGRIVSAGGSPRANLRAATVVPAVPAEDALVLAGAPRAEVLSRGAGPRRATTFSGGQQAKLVLFGGEETRLAWRVLLRPSAWEAWDVVVDAASGEVLRRQSLIWNLRGATVWENYPGAPVGGRPELRDLEPWLISREVMLGNNAYAIGDIYGEGFGLGPPGSHLEIPPSDAAGNYLYPRVSVDSPSSTPPCPPIVDGVGGCAWNHEVPWSWAPNLRQTATQTFYFVNLFHDYLLAPPISFTEAAGNFQLVNTTGQGLGGDPVIIASDMTAAVLGGLPLITTNAFFATVPDGLPPVLGTFLGSFPPWFSDVSWGDDASVIFHEVTHGLSCRLTKDIDFFCVLGLGFQSGAMGEGWSDWYSLDHLVSVGLERDDPAIEGDVVEGKYFDPHGFVGAGEGAIRTEGMDCTVGSTAPRCPGRPFTGPGGYTYGDIGRVLFPYGGPEVHAAGEVWTQTLWDLRRALIAKHGEVEGLWRARTLVTRAMELAPEKPSFLEMRNAILEAALAGPLHEETNLIWEVFARRGMGWLATTRGVNDPFPAEDFTDKPPRGARGVLAGAAIDAYTGAPAQGIELRFGGAGSPRGPWADTTNAGGQFAIADLPAATFPVLFIESPVDLLQRTPFVVTPGANWLDIPARTDWSAVSNGARIEQFNGPDYTDLGCGPGRMVDREQTFPAGWATSSAIHGGPKVLVVGLPRPVDVREVGIDPTATCLEDLAASLGEYEVYASADGAGWRLLAAGRFTPADNWRMNLVAADREAGLGARYVGLVMRAPQSSTGDGVDYMGAQELAVYGIGR